MPDIARDDAALRTASPNAAGALAPENPARGRRAVERSHAFPLRVGLFGLVALCAVTAVTAGEPVTRELKAGPSPIDNPLKGLVPYAEERKNAFPHSLEFDYLPLGPIVVGERKYDWSSLEEMLTPIAKRGRQAVFRIYLEYPDKFDGIPKYLRDAGLKITRWKNTNTEPFPAKEEETPDYEDPRLRAMLKDFLAEFGRRYDGDPRIGFITAGLLGTWGEWHTYPRSELFASKTVQAEVMDAYAAAFRRTPVLLRYPAGPDSFAHARNDHLPLGYHDDSFAWATLDTGRKQDDWFYMAALKAAGPKALAKWRTQPIGGEIRPELWGRIFDPDPKHPQAQDFARCVTETRVTWLMDTGMFHWKDKPTASRTGRAAEHVRRMGYDFHVRRVTLERARGDVRVSAEVENRGIAPLYHDWDAEFALLGGDGKPFAAAVAEGRLARLQPGESRILTATLKDGGGARGVLLRGRNPLAGGRAIGFANADQDRDLPGWLSLGPVPE